MGKLTERRIRETRHGPKDTWLGDGEGLWLRIRASGHKSFVLRHTRAGKVTHEALGEWPDDLTLIQARKECGRRRRLERSPSALSVGEAAETFLKRVIEGRYRRPEQIRGYLERDLAPIAARPLAEVRRTELAELIARKVQDGPVAANRLLEAVKRFFRYCVEMGWLEHSPAQALTRNIAGGKESTRARVLSDEEIRKVWAMPAPHGPLLRFLLLTGARIGEVQKATWNNINGEAWLIPAEHSKNARAHLVQLSPPARQVLDALPCRGELVFGVTSNTAVQAYIKRWCEREKIEPRFTPHDLRRTASTRMNAIGILPHIAERCLNHVLTGVLAIYNRADYIEERRAAFHALGREVERILSSS